ncbi:MAG: hypothetical protein AB8B79_05300 [Granulosicoccus sp.]
MTPDELIQQLRDIHLPEVYKVEDGTGISLLPYGVLGIMVSVVLILRYIRARIWLGEARRELVEIDKSLQLDNNASNRQNAQALLSLASNIAAHRNVMPLPNCAYLPMHQIGVLQLKQLHAHLVGVVAQ